MSERRQPDEDLEERRFDWGLREVVGGERAPDVTAAVLARAAAGDAGERPAPTLAWSRRGLVALAALVLIGVFTVFGVALAHRGLGERDLVLQAPGAQVQVVVTEAAAVAALPRDVKAVELRDLGDDVVAALVERCPDLEFLCVFASTATARPGTSPERAVSITDAALPAIGSLRRLRRLELIGVGHVKGTSLGELERLPLLEHLTLSCFDLDDTSLQVLPRLVSLRELDLGWNQGFGERGLAAIAGCTGLRTLSLSGSAPLRDAWFEPLARLTSLQSLNLLGTGVGRRFLFAKGFPEPLAPQFGARSLGVAALQNWPALRSLSLGSALHMEPAVGAQLARLCPALQDVDLYACIEIDDSTVADLLALRHLRTVRLGSCLKVTAAVVPLLAAASQLREVHFGETPWLTLAQAELLLQSGKDVTCERREDPAFETALALLRERFQAALAIPPVPVVRSLAELETLPDDLTHVELRGLGDVAAARLARFGQLRHVGVVRDDGEPGAAGFTRTGLRALAGLPRLETLELNNLPNLDPDALLELRTTTTLRSLDVVGVRVVAAGLQGLPELPALRTLTLNGITTFGDEGMQAIARCGGLGHLRLPNCGLAAKSVARVGALGLLVELDLRGNPGLVDEACWALRECAALRRLDVAGGTFTGLGLRQVPDGIEELGLAECQGLLPADATVLRDRFHGLRTLDVTANDWVTDAALVAIVANPSLQDLQLTACQQLTNASFATLRAARSLRSVKVMRTAAVSEEQQEQLRRERPELVVTRFVW